MPDPHSRIATNLAAVHRRIAAACAAAGRPENGAALVAVSKTFPATAIRGAWAAGQQDFGENYLQEAVAKQAELTDLAIAWHFIGPIQSNKTRSLAESFDWVHGVDRLKIAQRLAEQRPQEMPPLNVCVQVNISGEGSKAGCTPQETPDLCRAVAALPRLQLRGLMAIPAPSAPGADTRAPFRRLRLLWESLRAEGLPLDTLSAGMSDDLEAAIAEGATLVRVGSAIFGRRAAD
jgi:pyridoxal phosphate enzyme (YggS family)